MVNWLAIYMTIWDIHNVTTKSGKYSYSYSYIIICGDILNCIYIYNTR